MTRRPGTHRTPFSSRSLGTVGAVYANLTGTAGKPYVTGTAAGLLARALSLIAGFGNLWLLTQMLTKERFAGYVFVVALLYWLALVGTAGLDRTILYRLSRIEAAPGDLVGGPLVATALIVVLPLSVGLAGIVALGALIAGVEYPPGFVFWLSVLAPMIVTMCLGHVFEAWFWARGWVGPSVLIPAGGEIARTVCLIIAFFVLPTETGVAIAVIAAALVPLLIWLTIAPLGRLQRPTRIARRDIGYGLKAMLAKATHAGIYRLDILMIGVLATAAATADYAVAARLAAFVGVVSGLLVPVLTPRLGRYSAFGDRDVLLREYNQVRLLGLTAALISAALFAALGRSLLAVFGDYEQSYSLLMMLAAGSIVNVGFGPNAALLTIEGHAGWTLAARLVLLVAIIVLNLILIPPMGATGAALVMTLGTVAVNVLLCYIIWRLEQLSTISSGLVILIGAACVLLLLVGFGAVGGLVAALGLGALAGTLILRQSSLWLPAAKRLFAKAARARSVG